jgi:hypothetical protein
VIAPDQLQKNQGAKLGLLLSAVWDVKKETSNRTLKWGYKWDSVGIALHLVKQLNLSNAPKLQSMLPK